MLLYVHRNRRFIRDGIPGAQDGHLDFHTAPERGWGGGGVGWLVECCFTSTETVGLLGTGSREPRTATSIFTQLLSSQESVDDDDELMLNVLRCHLTY